MWCYAWQSLIFGETNYPKDGENGLRKGQNKGFLDLLENLVINFFWILFIKFILMALFLNKSHTCGKSGSWDIGQNALNQSDCKIFKLTLSLEQNDEKVWFFACWYWFVEIKS